MHFKAKKCTPAIALCSNVYLEQIGVYTILVLNHLIVLSLHVETSSNLSIFGCFHHKILYLLQPRKANKQID